MTEQFELNISFNPDGWGPINGEKISVFEEVPYSHFDKKDRYGRAADFAQQSPAALAYQKHPSYLKRREAEMAAAMTDFTYKHDAADDNTFQLVDTSKAPSKGRNLRGARMGGRGGRFGRGNGMPVRSDASNNGTSAFAGHKMQKQGGRNGSRNWANRQLNNRRDNRKIDRAPSLAVGGDWEMLEEFDLAQLLKLQANPPKVEDLCWAGHLDQYDDSYDKLTTRTKRVVKRIFEDKVFYDVTTSEDPVMERFAVDAIGDVYATDRIIAQLMAAPRSVYSWDIVIEKISGVVFLDKRENSSFDLLTVSETAVEAPQSTEEIERFNHPENLSLEATMINQHFSQQVLLEGSKGERKAYEPNPFFDDDDSGVEPASAVYRYRKFELGNIKLIARTELNCWLDKKGEQQLMTCCSILEWDSKYSGGVDWRRKIDQQKGAVLATELKNNSCKMAKWTVQALLAGADQMKLGYVSRSAPSNPYEHQILATQYFKPRDLAAQINLSINNIWGIIKMLCELLMSKPDGKYVLLKDPNKAIVRLYSIPIDTFEDEEDEEDEEEGEGEQKEGESSTVNDGDEAQGKSEA